ncbi:MAG: Nif3-like dinuclear metal center hexameric protein [Candidatus Lokiarchaeota archaeon]
MRCKEIVRFIKDEIFPRKFCINPQFYGFQYKSPTIKSNTNFKKVLLTLEADINSIYYALKNKIHLIISHHNFLASKIKIIDPYLIKRLNLLSKTSIGIFSLGSSFIAAEGGVSDCICENLFCRKNQTFDLKLNRRIIPIGRICEPEIYKTSNLKIDQDMITFKKLIERVQNNFSIELIKYSGNLNAQIKKICIIGGAFSKIEYLEKVLESNCNCLITGIFDYLEANFAFENGLNLIELPHYVNEIVALKKFSNILNLRFPYDEILVSTSEDIIKYSKL